MDFGGDCDIIDEEEINHLFSSQADLALMQEDLPLNAGAIHPGGHNDIVGGSAVGHAPPLTTRAVKSSLQRFIDGSMYSNLILPSFRPSGSPMDSAESTLVDSNVLSSIADSEFGNDICGDLGAVAVHTLREESTSLTIITTCGEDGMVLCGMGAESDDEEFVFSGLTSESTAAVCGHNFKAEDDNTDNHDEPKVSQTNGGILPHHVKSPTSQRQDLAERLTSPIVPATWLARVRHDGEERLTLAAATALTTSPRDNLQQQQSSAAAGSAADIRSPTISKQRSGCSCQRTKCLKLYCECFSAGKTCLPSDGSSEEGTCNCRDCGNTPSDIGSVQRQAAIVKSLTTKSRTYRPRTQMAHAEGFVENLHPNILHRNTTTTSTPLSLKKIDLNSPAALISQASDSSASLTNEGVRDKASLPQLPPPPRCFCKKSRCIKLYCDCFTAGLYCEDGRCKCTDCQNMGLKSSGEISDTAAFSSPKALGAFESSEFPVTTAFTTPAAPPKRKHQPQGTGTLKHKKSRRSVFTVSCSQNIPK